MSTRRPSITLTIAAAISLCGLVGCSSPPEAPQSQEQATSESQAQPDSTVAEVTEREVPEVCAALDLSPGVQLDGTPLGDCVALALASFGSGKMKIAGDSTGDFEFTYDPDFNVQGELQSPAGAMKIAFLGSDMWVDSGNGPVKGDPNSEDEEELMAAVAGLLTRQYADLSQTAQLIQGQPVWNIDETLSPVTLASGEQAEAYRIVSAGPFEWNGVPITEYVMWFGEDWVPLSTMASMEMMGMSSTNSQEFYDLGEPVVITPLG